LWRDDDVVVPRRRQAVISIVDIDAIVRMIMTDETKVFDVADNDLRAAASSCDAKDVNLHHPLHPLIDAWENVVGSGIGCWHLAQCLCEATQQPTITIMWCDDDIVVPHNNDDDLRPPRWGGRLVAYY
jgi:hypothetical protein